MKLWEDRDGNFNAAKWWSTVAYSVGTFVIVKMAIIGTLTAEIFFAYLGIVGGADVAKKWITVSNAPKEYK